MHDPVEEEVAETRVIAESNHQGLSRWGYAGLALFVVHVVLLFFPPLPPDVKGSLWWYLTGYVAVGLGLVEIVRLRWAAVAWARAAGWSLWILGLGTVAAALTLAVAFRSLAPVLYGRMQIEAGLFEPLTLFCYLAAAALLYSLARDRADAERRHWRTIATVYLLMGLEEIDYFGIFGGIVGRVEGVYVGSLHDLVNLAAEGLLGPLALGVLVAVSALIAVVLLWWDYLQPGRLLAMIGSTDFVWVTIGLGFLVASAAVEAQLFGANVAPPTLEEAIELCGAICLFFYALRFAGRDPRTSVSPVR